MLAVVLLGAGLDFGVSPAGAEGSECTRFTEISTGWASALAIGDDGAAYAFDFDYSAGMDRMIGLPSGVTATEVSGGYEHSLVLGSDGVAYATGDNSSGQLGDGTTEDRDSLVPMAGLPAGVMATAVAAGWRSSLVLGGDGVPYATNSTALSLQPVPGLPEGVTATAVSAGGYVIDEYTVLGSDGVAYVSLVWGSAVIPLTPIPGLPVGVSAVAVSAGVQHMLVLGSDGVVYGKGGNTYGQLGDGTTEDRDSLVPMTGLPAGTSAVAISASYDSSGVLGSDGIVYVTGGYRYAQVGPDEWEWQGSTTLVTVEGLPSSVRPTAVGAGGYFVLDDDGRLLIRFSGSAAQYMGLYCGEQPTPVAVVSGSPLEGVAPLTVNFDGSASHDGRGNAPLMWHWSFDAGPTSSDLVTSHTFAEPGRYAAGLMVANFFSPSYGVDWVYVTVRGAGGELPPVPLADVSPISGPAPLTVNFDASASQDPDGSVVGYHWQYGDRCDQYDPDTGEPTCDPAWEGSDTATGSHTYETPGTYWAFLAVTDDDGIAGQEIVEIRVGEAPQPPQAQDDSYRLASDGSLAVDAPGVLGNDSDPNRDVMTAVLVDAPSVGSLSLGADGSFTYSGGPAEGAVTFTYKAVDSGGLESAPATVTLRGNSRPVAAEDSETVHRGNSTTIDVLANDTGLDDTPLTVKIIGDPSMGSASVSGTSIRYTATLSANGTDRLTYEVRDSDGEVSQADVVVTVTDNQPVAVVDSAAVHRGNSTTIDVLANDTGVGDTPLTVKIIGDPSIGSASVSGTSIRYAANLSANGTDRLTYEVRDSDGDVSQADVVVTVTDNQPVAVADAVSSVAGSPATIDVLANDSGLGDSPLTVRVVGGPLVGSASVSGTSIAYLAPGGFDGTDVLRYEVRDSDGDVTQADVTLTVTNPDPAVIEEPRIESPAGGVSSDAAGNPVVSMPATRRQPFTWSARLACPFGIVVTARIWNGSYSAPMEHSPETDLWTGTIPANKITPGTIGIDMDCFPDRSASGSVATVKLYDPSGVVTDAFTQEPVAGASVRLFEVPGWTPRTGPDDTGEDSCETNESKAAGAPWSQPAPADLGVEADPLGGEIDPALNPMATADDGSYGWDVAEGCWYVVVEADGYETSVSPVVGVPSAVTDLNLVLTSADDVAPTVTEILSGPAGDNGWYRGPVEVTVKAADAGTGVWDLAWESSGAQVSPRSVVQADEVTFTVSAEGVTTVTAQGRDRAGNEATRTFDVKIDSEAPAVEIVAPADGAAFQQGANVPADYACTDTPSGVASCVGTVADGAAVDTSTVGSHSFVVTGRDGAGNETTRTVTYEVEAPPPPSGDAVSVQLSGGIRYANSGQLVSGDLEVVRGKDGKVASVRGTGKIPGVNGGEATVTVSLSRFSMLSVWTGQVTVRDPGSGISVTTPIFTGSLGGSGGQVTSASAWVDWSKWPPKSYRLTWTVTDNT